MQRPRTGPHRAAAIAVALALPLAACGTGGMAQVRLTRDCGPEDEACRAAGLDAPLAVGASLEPRVYTAMRGSAAPLLQLTSARPDIVATANHRLVGASPGVAAVLITTADGTVLDFLHVWVAEPNRLSIERYTESQSRLGEVTDTIELVVGESVYLAPAVFAGVQRLGGKGETEWQIDPAVASVHRTGTEDRRRIIARAPGSARLAVTALGLEASIDLVVIQ